MLPDVFFLLLPVNVFATSASNSYIEMETNGGGWFGTAQNLDYVEYNSIVVEIDFRLPTGTNDAAFVINGRDSTGIWDQQLLKIF